MLTRFRGGAGWMRLLIGSYTTRCQRGPRMVPGSSHLHVGRRRQPLSEAQGQSPVCHHKCVTLLWNRGLRYNHRVLKVRCARAYITTTVD